MKSYQKKISIISDVTSKTDGQVKLKPKRIVACKNRKIKGAEESFHLLITTHMKKYFCC